MISYHDGQPTRSLRDTRLQQIACRFDTSGLSLPGTIRHAYRQTSQQPVSTYSVATLCYMQPEGLLESKNCVVTGSSSGIGAAIARRFAAEGANLILVAKEKVQLQQVSQLKPVHIDKQLQGHHLHHLHAAVQSGCRQPARHGMTVHLCIMQVADECRAQGAASCDIHAVDLTASDAVETFATAVLSKHTQVDVLVNNAGMGAPGKNSPLEGRHTELTLPVLHRGHLLSCVHATLQQSGIASEQSLQFWLCLDRLHQHVRIRRSLSTLLQGTSSCGRSCSC